MKPLAFLPALLIAAHAFASPSQNPRAILDRIGIDQNVGAQLPLDATFKDESGQVVTLGDYFGKKPVVFAPVYYECPMLCGLVIQGIVRGLRAVPFTAGNEFDVVLLSFDPKDTASLADAKKRNAVKEYGKGRPDGWHFLTGEESQIRRVTDAIGFRYAYDEEQKQYAHAGTMLVLTPEGKVNRYFMGIDFSAKEIKYALMDASKNKIGSAIDQVLLFCFHYNPLVGKYGHFVLWGLRAFGVFTVFLIVRFVARSLRRDRAAVKEGAGR